MGEWFNGLPRRQQWLVVVGGVLVLAFLANNVMWKPQIKRQQSLQANNQRATETIAFMEQGVKQVKRLKRGAGRSSGRLSLSKMVDQAAARQGLRVSRFQPGKDNDAQIWLEKVEFNKVLAMLDQIETQYGLTVEKASINSAKTPGRVSARVRLKKGA